MPKGKKRGSEEINASSMADIAFLLLIFFLVTTTVDVEKGILHKLPEWTEEPPPEIENKERNTMVVLINSNDKLLVNNKLATVEELRAKAVEFIDNKGRNPKLSDSPTIAVISLQNDRGTSYGIYIEVQNELKAAYRELRDIEAMKQYGKTYNELREGATTSPEDKKKMKLIAKIYPMRLSEAEPKALGE